MDWFFTTLDRLLAAIWVAAFAVAASQAEPFSTQYAARTGQQLRQAEAHLKDVQSGVRYQTIAANVRAELETAAKTKLAAWRDTHDAVASTVPPLQPIALWRKGEPEVLNATWSAFVPGLPLTTWGVINTIIGILIGFALYEILKWPTMMLLRGSPRRRFKKRTNLG